MSDNLLLFLVRPVFRYPGSVNEYRCARFQDLIQLSGIGNGDIDGMSCVDHVLDVLVIDTDGSAGLKVALYDHGDFGIKDCAAGKSAPDGLVDLYRISPCFYGKNKCLGYDSDGIVNDDLVGQLGDRPAA